MMLLALDASLPCCMPKRGAQMWRRQRNGNIYLCAVDEKHASLASYLRLFFFSSPKLKPSYA